MSDPKTPELWKPNVLIVGSSGSGKSSSIRSIATNPKIRILDIERKGFPFRTPPVGVVPISDITTFHATLDGLHNNSSSNGVEVVIIDSLTKYFEMALAVSRAANKGYDIYSWYNANVARTLGKCKSANLIIVGIMIDEFVEILDPTGAKTSVRRAAISGREWEGKIEKEFLVTLFTDVRKNQQGRIEYGFLTNSDGICSAKSPLDMFRTNIIPNDLGQVLTAITSYYKPPTN